MKNLESLFPNLKKEIKVLLAEDEPITRKLLHRHLVTQGYQVLEASNGKEAWEIFLREKEKIHLVLLDWMMPEMDGVELCKKIRDLDLEHYVYIIFLSVKQEKEDIVACLEAGADDYLTKPFHAQELLARIKVGCRIIALEKALREANYKLSKMAITDSLTGILNRNAIIDGLKKELSRAIREGKYIHLIMIDLDHFKKVNDTYGHLIGDKVLIKLVEKLKSYLRPYDLIGRYGGEEFLVVLLENNEKTSIGIAERMRLYISEKPFVIENLELNITISLGVTSFKPTKEIDIDVILIDLLKQVDAALYEAKNKGRNCVVYKNFAL